MSAWTLEVHSQPIVIGECKLVRNPQARREVLSQALDYARAISAWSYEDLEAGVRKALKDPQLSLWGLINGSTHPEEVKLDEAQFVDAVERRLRASRFMVLIIGDGIQEGVEALTSYLQLHAGLHVGVALVDLSIWRGPDDALLVVPRVPLRTVLVERGIVVVGQEGRARIEAPPITAGVRALSSAAPRATSASEPEFYEQMDERRPGLSGLLRPFVDSLAELDIIPEFQRSLILRWRPSSDAPGSLGSINADGKTWLSAAWGTANRLGKPEAGDRYLQEIALAIGGTVRHYEKNWPEVMDANGRAVDAGVLLAAGRKWKEAMTRLIAEFRPQD